MGKPRAHAIRRAERVATGPWTAAEDTGLRRAVAAQGKNPATGPHGISFGNRLLRADSHWTIIGNRMTARNGKQCRERWANHLDPSIKKGPWSKQEEQLLDTLQKE